MPRITILGRPIDALTQEEAVETMRRFLREETQRHVMTPNPEMLVAAHRDPAFAAVIDRSDLNLPDGVGLLFIARMLGRSLPERVTGVDAVTALCARLGPEDSVFFLGAAEGIARKAAAALKAKNPRLVVAGAHAGSPRIEDAAHIVALVNDAKPRLLLVAYGAPAQDRWIDEHLHEMPTVRVAMGVGGTFDFLAGVQKRAPAFMGTLGLEWAWRFAHEPSRHKRMFNAVILFPLLALRSRFLREEAR